MQINVGIVRTDKLRLIAISKQRTHIMFSRTTRCSTQIEVPVMKHSDMKYLPVQEDLCVTQANSMQNFLNTCRARLEQISATEFLTALTLFVSTATIMNPMTSIFTSGKTYVLISHLVSEQSFGAITLFFFLISFFSILHGGLSFRKWALIAISIFWAAQFSLFLASYSSGYLTWLVSIFALQAVIPAGRIARKLKEI